MNIAKAFANNNVVLLVWKYDNIINDCLGFCIKRTDVVNNKTTTLLSMVGFDKKDTTSKKFNPTDIWPIQKFNWRDFTAQSGSTYKYTIIPMIRQINSYKNLVPDNNKKVITNEVTLSAGTGKIKAYFNRGILATQYLSSQVPKGPSGLPNYKILLERVKQPGDKLRNKLADELRPALISLIDKAIKDNGECYCALYELNDQELLAKLLEGGKRIHLILSNTGPNDETNQVSRQSLHDSDVDIIDRFVPSGHIGHNKFVVYVNSNKKPHSVLSGSTNWTYTGLCCQSNNAIIIESKQLAEHYLDYWNRLKDDDGTQEADFRKQNNTKLSAKIISTDISLWFSPNTKAKNKTSKSKAPSDIAEVFALMNSAKKSILFLAFQPGTPSIIDEAANIQESKPDLFIRGAATDLEAVDNFGVTLYHRGVYEPVVVGAQALQDDFAYWMSELLKSSPMAHAIIHDKIVVIDAFTDDCVVITGSHNLGYRASYNNEENLLIIKNDNELATMYATHIMDIYDHYRWRYYMSKNTDTTKRFEGLNKDPKWQEPYFNNKRGESIDTRFWL